MIVYYMDIVKRKAILKYLMGVWRKRSFLIPNRSKVRIEQGGG
jgi:hypothetical protein